MNLQLSHHYLVSINSVSYILFVYIFQTGFHYSIGQSILSIHGEYQIVTVIAQRERPIGVRAPSITANQITAFLSSRGAAQKGDIHIKRAAFLSSSEELTSLEFIPTSINRPKLIKLILSFVSIQGCRISKPLIQWFD